MTARDLVSEEQHLFDVIRSPRFLAMEGLGNEVPFFIYPFDPTDALEVQKVEHRLINKLALEGITVFKVNLYDLSIDVLKERGIWDRVIEIEPEQDKNDFRELLQGLLDPGDQLKQAFASQIAEQDFGVLFLTGVGEVFPYIRSHNVLNNLQSVLKDKPMLLFFPGDYRQSETLGSSLELFGRLHDDQYYRAKNILEQEA